MLNSSEWITKIDRYTEHPPDTHQIKTTSTNLPTNKKITMSDLSRTDRLGMHGISNCLNFRSNSMLLNDSKGV